MSDLRRPDAVQWSGMVLVPLDLEKSHFLRCEPAGATRVRLLLTHERGDRSTPLHRALRDVLCLTSGCEVRHRFDAERDDLEIEHGGGLRIELGDPGVGGVVAARLAFAAAPASPTPEIGYQLSPFECRYLTEYGRLYPVPPGPPAQRQPRTDLHTHYAGCVAASDLVDLAANVGVSYPADLLLAAGIRADGGAGIPVSTLSQPIRRALAEQLEVPTDRRIRFAGMEKIYRLRSPLTKHPDMFVPLLRRIAHDYAAMGVDYAELSLGDVATAQRLRAVHAHVPTIERETGVTLRFLAAVNRHDDLEWDLDYLDRLRQVVASRYIVGVDFMGHETNSTYAFATQLRAVAQWASDARPGFVIRVHAGENPAHPENVRAAAECTADCDVMLRIGHGLYGVDETTIDLLRARKVIVEFNLNSNFALNNIQCLGEAPIHRYLRCGVRVVLGSDGYGIYRTTPALESRAAWLCGVDDDGLAQIAEYERDYLAARRARDQGIVVADFEVPDDPPLVHFSAAVTERKQAQRQLRSRQLRAALAAADVPLLTSTALRKSVEGWRCVSIAGAWKHSWARLPADEKMRARRVVEEIVDALEEDVHVLITGGTRHGIEDIVATRARGRGIRHIGVLVETTPPESVESALIDGAAIAGRSLHDKAGFLYPFLREVDGICLFVGGGNIVSDEIQCARNLRLPYLLMTGISGASGDHAREQPQRAFRSAKEVIAMVKGERQGAKGGRFRFRGANPTVDVVVIRRHSETFALELLLIRRDLDSHTESGVWALPGGFVDTAATPGEAWIPGAETRELAAVRELYEETGLDVRDLADRLQLVGEYAGGGRDPRDTETSWSHSSAFFLLLPPERACAPLSGGDDASDARWFAVDSLPPRLAFDHAQIIDDWMRWFGVVSASPPAADER